VAEESITATADGLVEGRETSGRGDRVIVDKLEWSGIKIQIKIMTRLA